MINCDIKEFNLNEYLTYLDSNLEYDAEQNKTLDMSSLDYSSLFKRLVGLSIGEPKLENFLTLYVIASIMLKTNCCNDDSNEFVIATTMLYTYLAESESHYKVEEINKQLIQRYNFIVYNCSISKFAIVVHSLEVLMPTYAKRLEKNKKKKVKEEN